MEDCMAHFYGTVEGKSGSLASRTGSKASGLEVTAKSWEGEISLTLSHKDGRDYVTILSGPHGNPNVVLYDGPVDYAPAFARIINAENAA